MYISGLFVFLINNSCETVSGDVAIFSVSSFFSVISINVKLLNKKNIE